MTDDFAGVDIAGLDNGGPDIDGLDIAGLDIDGRMCGQLTELKLQNFISFSLRRPKSKANIMNESRVHSCLAKFYNGSYSRL